MSWEVGADPQRVVNEIAKAVKGSARLILATDPDREGEAISWHLLKILEQKRVLSGVAVERVAFNAVTKDAILTAMANPRQIDEPLVDAYLARRALDYLVGFTLSPVLWRKLPGAKSAGRVQSVALRLVCDREAEIEAFKTREYWTVEASLKTTGGDAPGAACGPRWQEARQVRHRGQNHRARLPRRHQGPALQGGEYRGEGPQAPPRPALHHLVAATGGVAQAWASPRVRPCRSPSASMKASTSAARPWASLLI